MAAASGALLSLSLPPASFWPLVFVAPVPFLWLLRGSRPGRAALCGLVFGFVYFGALLYWIALFGELAWLSLVAMSAGYMALFGALAPALWRPEHPILGTIGLAALWTVIEWVRGAFPLGGFAWGQLGSTQVDAPALPLASVAGVWGLSFVVLLTSGLLLLAIERWGSGRQGRALGLAGAALALVMLPAAVPLPEPEGPRIHVAAIQVDVSSVEHLVGAEEDAAVARLNAERHRGLGEDPPELVVWGEGALDPGVTGDPTLMAEVSDVIRRVGTPTIAGAVVDDPDGRQYTSTLAFDGSGAIVDRYDKLKLVPFGEYVPFRDSLDWISATRQIEVDRSPGAEVSLISLPGLPAIGTPICYENSFPAIDREMVRQGAGFLVLTINNASYDRTAASEQHLQMSRLRAVENGRWVVHAAVSGISAFIDPEGRVVASAGLFEPATLRRAVVSSSQTTPYTRFGDWVPWASIVTVLGVLAIPRGRRRQARRPEPLPERPRTLVILPTYEERETIGTVLDGLAALDRDLDVLVVDDGSPDGTAEIVRERAEPDPRLRLVERPSKSGLASAYAVGFERAMTEGYDVAVEMDSDLSHDPEELPRLLDTVAQHDDVVIGSRYVPGGSVTNWSRPRLLLSKGGNRYARLCLGIPLKDATSGFRAYRTPALREILVTPVTSDGYGFQIELVYRAWNLGLSVGEAPITFREREHGRSKISRRIVVEALWLVTRWGFRARFRPDPNPA
ncbi:MAG TPA: apolipoprotein N-acyltransferase, partial [Actinomycetota bacterium]|nr:apolipoprotein N-acyltransferase [Actinomycetota bacterium]